jgi:hypothetical protein
MAGAAPSARGRRLFGNLVVFQNKHARSGLRFSAWLWVAQQTTAVGFLATRGSLRDPQAPGGSV